MIRLFSEQLADALELGLQAKQANWNGPHAGEEIKPHCLWAN